MTVTPDPVHYVVDRAEHLEFCKRRALEYLPGDPAQAMASMTSDLGAHEGTRGHVMTTCVLMMQLYMSGNLERPEEMAKFIRGFN